MADQVQDSELGQVTLPIWRFQGGIAVNLPGSRGLNDSAVVEAVTDDYITDEFRGGLDSLGSLPTHHVVDRGEGDISSKQAIGEYGGDDEDRTTEEHFERDQDERDQEERDRDRDRDVK